MEEHLHQSRGSVSAGVDKENASTGNSEPSATGTRIEYGSDFRVPEYAKNLHQPRTAVVTGASTGIGEHTVRQLRALGWKVIAVARRQERLEKLAQETGCNFFAADVSDEQQVAALAKYAAEIGKVDAVVNVAGGALGLDSVAEAIPQRWRDMYERNVLTALLTTNAFLPELRERGGDVLFVTSQAGHGPYPGGAGYCAAKHAERIMAETMRMELMGEPVRIIEIAPGMVHTPEFSLTRLGSQEAADNVYKGVDQPLLGEDVAEAIVWTLTRPPHVNIDSLIVRPRAQANNLMVARKQD